MPAGSMPFGASSIRQASAWPISAAAAASIRGRGAARRPRGHGRRLLRGDGRRRATRRPPASHLLPTGRCHGDRPAVGRADVVFQRALIHHLRALSRASPKPPPAGPRRQTDRPAIDAGRHPGPGSAGTAGLLLRASAIAGHRDRAPADRCGSARRPAPTALSAHREHPGEGAATGGLPRRGATNSSGDEDAGARHRRSLLALQTSIRPATASVQSLPIATSRSSLRVAIGTSVCDGPMVTI